MSLRPGQSKQPTAKAEREVEGRPPGQGEMGRPLVQRLVIQWQRIAGPMVPLKESPRLLLWSMWTPNLHACLFS